MEKMTPTDRAALARKLLLTVGELAELAADCDLPRSFFILREARRVIYEETYGLV